MPALLLGAIDGRPNSTMMTVSCPFLHTLLYAIAIKDLGDLVGTAPSALYIGGGHT